MPMPWKTRLRIQTRDQTFLWKMVLAIVGTGVMIGVLITAFPQLLPREADSQLLASLRAGDGLGVEVALEAMLADESVSLEQLVDGLDHAESWLTPTEGNAKELNQLLQKLGHEPVSAARVAKLLADSQRPEEQRKILESFWQSLSTRNLAESLVNLAEKNVPTANYAVGKFWFSRDANYPAAKAFEKEGQRPEAKSSREFAIDIYLMEDDWEELNRLRQLPHYAEELPPYVNIRHASLERRWWDSWWLIPSAMIDRMKFGPTCMALIAGLLWFLFCLHAGQVDSPHGARWPLMFAAVLLGMLSNWPTLFAIDWQELIWGLDDSKELIPGIKFYVLGVGLREEVSKLLLLLPLVPWLVRRGSDLETLMVAACVGLGFAMNENIGYFARTASTATIGRFLTANFFHMAATGLIGLAVCRAIRYPRTLIPDAIGLFGLIVFAHGMYDALISLPDLSDYGFGSMIIYILLSYQFFHELRTMRTDRPETVSLTATFLFGISMLTSITFIYLSARFGCQMAFAALVPSVLSTALMVIMFLREMPGSLAANR